MADGNPIAVDPERGAAQRHGWRVATLAGQGNQAAKQERTDDADHPDSDRLGE